MMKKLLILFISLGLLSSCQTETKAEETENTETELAVAEGPLDWTKNANIYEVNIRQYTPEGTFNAFATHLDRLQAMGVKILWIMPIQPIGKLNRKGGLGSYYSIADYTETNPNFGTMEDFKNLVEEAHKRDMKVILDWVANHTSFDHPWTEAHPEWYTQDSLGNIVAPVEDWSDVADLNYSDKGLWKAMREEMKFWLKEANIDGFRCDVAMMVPSEFWAGTRAALDSVKPVFMLAEAEGPEFHEAFDMTYGWEMHHIMNEIAKGEMSFENWKEFLIKEDSTYAEEDLRMNFVTNHDENSWNGTAYVRMGNNVQNFFLLGMGTKRAMPLIYSGQEAGLNDTLEFFEKDTISWADESQYDFYTKCLALKTGNPAMASGIGQGDFEIINTSSPMVIGYRRILNNHRVSIIMNFSDSDFELPLSKHGAEGEAQNYMSGESLDLSGSHTLPANGHLIIVSE